MASEESLLVEYKFVHKEVIRLNYQLWTTAQILIPLSIAGIGILLNLSAHSWQTLTAIFIITLSSSLVLWGWYKIAVRWLTYQSIAQYRAIEIERELCLWCTRYELLAPGIQSAATDNIESFSDEEKERFEKVPTGIISKGEKTSTIIRHLVILMILSWLLLLLREMFICFGYL